MHVKYCGVDQYFIGSVLYIIANHVLTGSVEENCKEVFRRVKIFYCQNRTKCRYATLSKNMMNNQGTAKLKGRAAEIKHLKPALVRLCDDVLDNSDQLHKHVKLALRFNVQMDKTIDAHKECYKLPDGVAQGFLRDAQTFLTQYQACAREVIARTAAGVMAPRVQCFDITIKCYYLLHCALQAAWINPSKSWRFMGEDYMIHATRLLGACTKATQPRHVCAKFLNRQLVALDMRFQMHRERELAAAAALDTLD